MQFSNKNSNDIQNGSDPAEVLLSILNADNSDEYIKKLIHLCDSGGYPDDENNPKYKILHSSKDDKYYSIVVEVIFDEKSHGQGCSVVP